MDESWRERLARGRVLLDGGLGSSLIATGEVATTKVAGAALAAPELLLEVHRGFLAAGAEAVLTNTFGTSRPALAESDHAGRWEELNHAAVRLARQAADERGGAFVLGDIGPIGFWSRSTSGASMSPRPASGTEDLSLPRAEALAAAYREHGALLIEAGVDALLVETLPGEAEALIALAALREVCDASITVSFTTTRADGVFTTLAGEPVVEVLANLEAAGADALGLNCGEGSEALLQALPECLAAVGVPLVAKPNAGQPIPGEWGPVYTQEPGAFAADLARATLLGVSAVGGCCGADERFIAALWACLGGR